jgi:hypothetical protein
MSCIVAQAPRKTVRLTDGQTIEGRVMNKDFQTSSLTDDQRFGCCGKSTATGIGGECNATG